MAIVILSAVAFCIFGFVFFIYYSRHKTFKDRDEIGLKGPEPNWLFGNLLDLAKRNHNTGYDDSYNLFLELHEEFGETFRLFVGGLTYIFISNEDDIKEVYITKFSNFSERFVPSHIERSSLSQSLFFATYPVWKKCRSVVSQFFSTKSLKSMYGLVEDKINIFLNVLEKKSRFDKPFNVHEDFKALSLDIIAKCAFGMDSDCLTNRKDPFLQNSEKFVENIDMRKSWITSGALFLQELDWLWKILYSFTELAKFEIPLIEMFDELYQSQNENSEYTNILKLMMDKREKELYSEKKMTKQEIIENCFSILLGGYDTSSTSLEFSTYLLAKYPTIQRRLHEEILEVKMETGLNYDSIFKMPYLDAFYKESLRFYPPVFHSAQRKCLKDTVIGNQMIPKGAIVAMIPYTVHRNENNWEKANVFVPERFLENNDNLSLKWVPYGVGPRICVGMKLAEMEIKITLVKMIEKFEISMNCNAKELIPECHGVVMQPKDGVYVKMKLR